MTAIAGADHREAGDQDPKAGHHQVRGMGVTKVGVTTVAAVGLSGRGIAGVMDRVIAGDTGIMGVEAGRRAAITTTDLRVAAGLPAGETAVAIGVRVMAKSVAEGGITIAGAVTAGASSSNSSKGRTPIPLELMATPGAISRNPSDYPKTNTPGSLTSYRAR